ncbi:phage helicase [Ligilactobacillus ruminis DPC 6832]|uniref:Phage helicase n=1 Tax=Ligilactobacillus ruminis DPC 6832 TaxID=1402208 RepID=A0A837DWF6_9LACO|nr:hypothetical protein [Ligilactobacillus ruminis]KIC04703.1 phage helicase [Ligilactobacillus ruminis DPC 6832]
MKLNEEYIKVRDAKANEIGWARVEGDKIFLDNDFKNYEVGQEIKVNDEGEIVWAGPTLEERVKALDEKKKAEKLAENEKFVGAKVIRKDGVKGVATKATLEGITIEFEDGTSRRWQKDAVESHLEK